MSPIVTLQDVSFELPNGRELFRHLNLSLNAHLTALVGPNGVGKTTLARLLEGELEPTAGALRRTGSIVYLPQRQGPRGETVEAFLGDTWSALGERLLENIDRHSLCTTLSGGQWMRVRLARTLSDQFLILDEPTNDLDRRGREAILQFLGSHTGGALLISHDRQCLSVCEEILELSSRGLAKYGGGWPAYLKEKERERSNLEKALNLARRERDAALADRSEQRECQEKRNQRGSKTAARGGQAKILLGRRKRHAQATTGKIDVATLDRANDAVRELHQTFSLLKVDPVMNAELVGLAIPSQKLVAEAENFNIRFQDFIYHKDLNFCWRGKIRIALKGVNGSGKSTLLKAIAGSEFASRGKLRRGDLHTLYIDQQCALLDDKKSIFANVKDSARLSDTEIRNALARFLFTKDAVFESVKDLSGGERLRAALAKGLLSKKPELLILDEPTNNLDLANIEFLESLISQFCGALIVISHDDIFLQNCGIDQELVVPHLRDNANL